MAETLGVGFLGAGAVTQAIHLPTLATLGDAFRVARVMDADANVAERVASRCGASPTTDEAEVIGASDVDVVVVCSPNSFHADQVIAACDAGKRAVLCEKPLATSHDEAGAVARAVARSGTALVVGTMHVYDPTWRAAVDRWSALGERAVLVRSTILLPGNDVFVDQATDLVSAPPAPPGEHPNLGALMRAAILGLAIHDLPLLRTLVPSPGRVVAGRYVRPFGYSIVVDHGDAVTELHALMPGVWAPAWTVDAVGHDARLRVEFPPSYVLAGSSASAVNGYQAQWRHLHDVVCEGASPIVPVGTAIDDLHWALDLAHQVEEMLA